MPQTQLGTAEQLLEELRGWVEHETPTTDAVAVNGLMDRCEADLRAVGGCITRIPGRDGYGDTLICHTPGTGAPIVVAGHLDTVWDHGTLAGPMPFRIDGDRAYGPGIYDMKAGSFMAFHSVREILRQKVKTKRPITLLLTPDEEVGSPTSREPIEQAARGARAVLIPEPAGAGGACVTARKGVGRFVIDVRGVSAHAGGNWAGGRSAVGRSDQTKVSMAGAPSTASPPAASATPRSSHTDCSLRPSCPPPTAPPSAAGSTPMPAGRAAAPMARRATTCWRWTSCCWAASACTARRWMLRRWSACAPIRGASARCTARRGASARTRRS